MKKNLFFVAASAVLVSSCFAVDVSFKSPSEEMGALSVGVQMEDAYTKAMSESELLASAKVNIYMADFSGMVRSYTYSDIPATIYLPVDTYRVDVEAGECVKPSPAVASWDQKSYKGSKEFSIVAGQNTSVQVEAKVNNAVTQIAFAPSVAENFAAYSLSIGIDGNDLVYDATTAGQSGYFIVDGLVDPSFSWTFTGTLNSGDAFTKSGTVDNVEPGKLYKMSFKYTLKDGDLTFELLVDYGTDVFDDTIIFEPVSTGLASTSRYEVWAAHASVYADVDESEYSDPSAVKFEYSTDGSNWISVNSTRTSEGSYKAVLTGLTPSTSYTYRLVIAGEVIGDTKNFTTEDAPAVPNGSFETVSKVGDYYVWFDPSSSDAASQNMWWGSGNGTSDVAGSASMGIVITVPDESSKMDGARSVCLQSRSIIGMLAAGNLFSGKFMGLVGTSGGRVAFGRPWTARPTALKCWVKYSTSKVNIIKSAPAGVTVTKNDYDKGMVRVALGTWDYKQYGGTKESPILVNTTVPSTIIDFTNDPSTIALGEAVFVGDESNSTNVWKEITIPIVYSNENEYPTHIVISCASSYYGDYFTGCDSSKLWIDKMELIYE